MSEKRLIEKIVNSELIKRNDKIVIGLSGGPDSTALTLLLNKLKNKYNLSLFLIHINYHLRGKDSKKDEVFCKNLASKLELPFFIHSVNKNSLKTNDSIQDTARKIRLEYLAKIAQKNKANKIALAHQSDDQAETILMKLLRGSGKKGLSGISKRRVLTPDVEIIHPLLSISRKEILAFLKKTKQPYRLDASNLKPVYFRNKIRVNLIPFIEKKYQPNIKQILNNMAEILESENDYFEETIKRISPEFVIKKTSKTLTINTQKLLKVHPAIQSRLLQFFIKKFTKGYNVDFNQIHSIQKILLKKEASLDLPKKITIKKNIGELIILKSHTVKVKKLAIE